MLPSERPSLLVQMSASNQDQFGSETQRYLDEPTPSNALQQGSMRQLSPDNFQRTLNSVQWYNWITGNTAAKRRRVEQVEEDHIRKINTPVFGVFGGDRGPSGMNEATKEVFKKRLTGAHQSNASTSFWSW